MDPNAVAGMVFTLALVLVVGGFIMLRPLTTRLGMFLEWKVRDQKLDTGASADEVKQLREALHNLEADVRLLSERQVFMEQLLAGRDPDAIAGSRNRPALGTPVVEAEDWRRE